MLQKRISIDFGNYNIKMVRGHMGLQLACGPRQKVTIEGVNIVRTPDEQVVDGLIVDPPKLAKELENSIKQLREYSSEAIITVSSSQIVVRGIEIENWNQEVESTMAQHLGVSLDDYMVDYKILDKQADKRCMMAVAVPKHIIHNYLDFLKCAELQCNSIDFAGNSLTKQIAAEVGVSSQTVAIVDIGYRHTNVTIMTNGKFSSFRMFHHACESMFRAVCERIHCPWDESKELVKKYGIMPCDESGYAGQYVDVSYAIKDVLSWLCGDISAYFNEAGASVDKMVLVGGGALLKNLDEYMRKAFNMHVTRHTRVGNVKMSEVDEAELGAYYASCLGAFK